MPGAYKQALGIFRFLIAYALALLFLEDKSLNKKSSPRRARNENIKMMVMRIRGYVDFLLSFFIEIIKLSYVGSFGFKKGLSHR